VLATTTIPFSPTTRKFRERDQHDGSTLLKVSSQLLVLTFFSHRGQNTHTHRQCGLFLCVGLHTKLSGANRKNVVSFFLGKRKRRRREKKNSRTKPKGALSQVLFSFLAPAPVLHTTHSALALYTLVVHYTHTHSHRSAQIHTRRSNGTTRLGSAPIWAQGKEGAARLFSPFIFHVEEKKKILLLLLGLEKKNWQCRDEKKKEEETLLFLSK
jgi:hypothetical protein